MNKHVIAGLILAGSIVAAPAAKALPLLDIGVGAGMLTFEDDSSSAVAVNGMVGVNIPVVPLLGVEGALTQTVSDGGFDTPFGEASYSGNTLGAFATITSPTPFFKVKAKLGMVRSDFDIGGSSNSSTDFAFGAALQAGDWQFELTRTMIDDNGFEQDLDYLSVSYVF